MGLNIYTFYSYSLTEKADLLKNEGEYITFRKENNCFIDLYVIDKYLIEVRHNSNIFNIQSIELIDPKDERLILFADDVSLSDLYRA